MFILFQSEKENFYGKGVSTTILDKAILKGGDREIEVGTIQLLPKEIEVLKMIYQELPTKKIAERLQVSHRTVEGYRQLLFQKTNTQNLTGLIKFAIRNGFTGEGKNYKL